ncbi:hypothetical protein QBE52_14485 [Clostridiaceae bacterium 35-E11]
MSDNNVVQQQICVNVEGGVVETCTNAPVALEPITTGAVAKIPVVLAELAVQFNVTSTIELPEPALEIKNIKKRVKVTQCMLLQDTNVLFIRGFVRKNIDYATGFCANDQGVCGEIHHCTIDVPFECTTTVTFNGTPPAPVAENTISEFEYFRTQDLPNTFAEKDKLLSGDLSEYNQISTEFYNELPYCELISSRIVEFDEYINRTPVIGGPFEENFFTEVEEKMVIFLTLKILQKQQVAIDAIAEG